jgi:hypothetical protein
MVSLMAHIEIVMGQKQNRGDRKKSLFQDIRYCFKNLVFNLTVHAKYTVQITYQAKFGRNGDRICENHHHPSGKILYLPSP